jgi:mono/diheme cytochrome c family protein
VNRVSFRAIGLVLVLCMLIGQRAAAGEGQSPAPSFPAPARTTLSGIYSIDQATRGEETYHSICLSCHPAGTYKGGTFKDMWNGRPLSALFESISERMPKNEPGSLTREEYAQVIAYLLKVNNMPAGTSEMAADAVLLKDITIEFGK